MTEEDQPMSVYCECAPNQGRPDFVVPGLVCVNCSKPLKTRETYFEALRAASVKLTVLEARRRRILARAKSRPAEYYGRWVR